MSYTVYSGTAAALNGTNIANFNIGDRIQISDETPNVANVHISGNQLIYDGSDAITIGNLGAGRYVVRALGTSGTEIRLQQDAHNDFNGDGQSDILWQNSDGTVHDWLGQPSTGAFAGNTANLNVVVPSGWQVVGTGDFNGDGRVDILWQNSDGTVHDWLGQANGGFADNSANLNITVPTNWHVVGTGDFNGDGHTYFLWRSTDGTVHDWLGQANGSFAGNTANLNINVPTNWQVVGTGDFNGDGYDDILWRSTDGTVHDWLGQANGGFAGNTANVNINVPTNWQVVGTGDFNGDGLSDILWRNTTDGTYHEWLGQTNGTFAGNATFNAMNFNPGNDSHVVGTGDYNGDGIDDLLFRNSAGTVTEWLGQANGSFVQNTANVDTSVPTSWHILDPFVHDPLI